MRKNVFILLIVSLALGFTACNKVKTDTNDSEFIKNPDPSALAQRFTVVNQPVVWSNALKSTALTINATVEWNLGTMANPNSSANDLLSASSVEEDANYVYVGFHDRGDEFYGNIVSVSKDYGTDGGLFDEVQSPTIDFNDIEMANGYLWAAGESFNRGAEAVRFGINVSSGVAQINATASLKMPIFGASANSITSIGDNVWISSGSANHSGNQGGLIVLNATNPDADPLFKENKDNAKHFDAEAAGKGLWIFGDNSGYTSVWIFDLASASPFTPISKTLINYSVTAFGKNAVDVHGDYAYLAMGADGVVRVDLTGANLGTVTKFSNEAGYKGLANGVKTDGTYVYVAHGADGLVILDMNLDYITSWDGDFNSDGNTNDGSCNYVDIAPVADVGYAATVYVAFGQGGMNKLNILP